MYPIEVELTSAELDIVFRVRTLIGDEKEIFIDDINSASCATVLASGSIYQLQEPKGYPLQILLNGEELTTSGSVTANVLGYKYIQFSSPVVTRGSNLLVTYNHFRYSDIEILDIYDTAATTFLTNQCNLTTTEIGIDLLVLSTAYVLLTKDLNDYIKGAVTIEDGDSSFNASSRPGALMNLLKMIASQLKDSIETKTNCKMLSLPVYKVE